MIIDGVETSSVAEHSLHKIRRDKLGFIFQTYYLIPTLTAMQNVLVPVMPIGGGDKYHKRATRLLDVVGLKERMHHKPNQLSGGEQQRVAIARALVSKPKILLADEPTGALDGKTGEMILSLLKSLAGEMTVVMVTHNSGLGAQSDRVINLLDGKIIE